MSTVAPNPSDASKNVQNGTEIPTTSDVTQEVPVEGEVPTQIHLYIPRQAYLIPLATTSTGLALGFLRGTRAASLRFLAENAHRPPKTVEEWYFYHKTKNYRVIMGGMRQSGREGAKFAAAGVCWVGFEEAARRVGHGVEEFKEVVAGAGLAATVAAVYRLPKRLSVQVGLLGLVGGSVMGLLRRTQDALGKQMDETSTS